VTSSYDLPSRPCRWPSPKGCRHPRWPDRR
jgi:hypothetical protein